MLASIISAGMSKIGKRENLTSRELFAEAFIECMDRVRNLDRKEIGVIYVGSQSEIYEHQIMYGNLIAETAGLLPKPAFRVEGCAAAGAIALRSAVVDVMAGLHDIVLAVGVERLTAQCVYIVTVVLLSSPPPFFKYYN